MDNAKNKKSLKALALAIVLVLIVAAALIAAGKKNDETEPTELIKMNDETGAAELIKENDETEAAEPIAYTTDYVELFYPHEWGEKTRVSIENSETSSVAAFFYIMENGSQVPLFDVIFGQRETGAYLGEIRTESGDLIPVCVLSHELDQSIKWMQTDIAAYYAMQEDANFLIDQLPLVTDLQAAEDIAIETEFATLRFPGKWAGQLRTDSDGNSIAFYGTVEGMPEFRLFDVCFDVEEQEALGYLETESGKPCYVSVQIYSIEKEEGWSDYQMEQLMAVQEDLNYLLSNLELKSGTAQIQEINR